MMIAIMAVYLVLLFVLVRFGIVSLQPVLEVIALHRAAAAEPAAVHPDGMGRAAGAGAGGPQLGFDRARAWPAK